VLVRVTHWITVISFFALLISGVEILISHPRFYWGETGNALTPPLFQIPIPSSRATVPTSYDYVLSDQNGWSRYLHFQAAWAALLTGLVYVRIASLVLLVSCFMIFPRACPLWPSTRPRHSSRLSVIIE
jgi:Ni,Fe-hydrogenase I cytochrome b subunit